MEGLIPFLFHAIKKQRQPANVYRCLSDNSIGRSYHVLLGEGSSHRRTHSEFQPPPTVDLFTAGSKQVTSPGRAAALFSCAGSGLKRRGFASAGSKEAKSN